MSEDYYSSSLTDVRKYTFPFKVYFWLGICILLGIVNLVYIIFKPDVNPLLQLFFYSIPANIAISVFPHEPIIIKFGKQYDLFLISSISILSTMIAAILDHVVFTPLLNHEKFSGYKNNTVYQKSRLYFDKFPFLTIALAALAPIPFWPLKLLAFSRQYPLGKYLSALFIGRFPKYYLLAAFGSVTLIPNWFIWLLFSTILLTAIYSWIKPKKK